MAVNVIVDTSFLVAWLDAADGHHRWAMSQAPQCAPPWNTCEAALTECFFLLGRSGGRALAALLRRGGLVVSFDFTEQAEPVLRLIERYASIPMSLADACLVRMTELQPDPVLVTADSVFAVYRRNGRQVIPCVTPP